MLERLWRALGWDRRALDYADPALAYLYRSRTSSGEPVTVDRAVALSAVWACTTLIAGSIAAMPLLLYRRGADGARERYEDHPLYDVLKTRPNPVQPVTTFWESMIVALLLRGNAFAQITRDDFGRVRALWFTSPDRVRFELLKTGRLRYWVTTSTGAAQPVSDDQMLHIVGPMSPDGYSGRSVITVFRETLGLGLALERYGGEFFSNAATPRGVLKTDAVLSGDAIKRLKASLAEDQEQPGSRHKTLVLEQGLEFQALGVSHEDSQFLESRRFTTEEIARIFNMIGADIKGSMTYSNSELESLRLLKYTLGPWLARIESAVNFYCVLPAERRQMYAEYLPDALLATDTAGRYTAYKTGLEAGFLTIDEVRRKENLPALPTRVPAL
jgi:HK97 family phage portal protein